MSFSVGQKVICVESGKNLAGYTVVKGQIYTVLFTGYQRETDRAYAYDYVVVEEAPGQWLCSRFRPLTDILNEQSEADLARIIEEVQEEITVEV